MLFISWPIAPSVLMLSCSEVNRMPLFLKSSNSVRIFFSERPSRSSLYTTSVSPSRRKFMQASSSGRFCWRPVIFSEKIFSHPAAFNASSCISKCCSLVETRAYPIFILYRFNWLMKVLILHFLKYEDIKSSYSSRMYWLNPFCFIAKRSLSNSPMVTICLPITVNCSHSPFSVCKTIERTVNGRNEMTLTQVLQTGETTGNSTWDGNQYVDFHLEFYILFRFSHGKELL